jgi:6-pyruvoyltetrahydropterin/6-carboxytetrahydropterin synthase
VNTCTKRIEFDYAHRLLGHTGKCGHLHGHRAAVEVTVARIAGLDDVGRVIDFGTVRRSFGAWIDSMLDHACIVALEDSALREFLRSQKSKYFELPAGMTPTAENLAHCLFDVAVKTFEGCPRLQVMKVRFYETPTSYAEWTP